MKKVRQAIRAFFFPPPGSTRWRRIMPYAVLGTLSISVFVTIVFLWDYTNSPKFCGTTCHLMPPEYTSYLASPHARVSCVDCHMSQDYTMVKAWRKVGEVKHMVSLIFKRYEFPIRAHELTPARESCEQCHYPQKFSDDSLREIKRFGDDSQNSPISTYLVLKTGGGTKRQGLGRGIHWHIENDVYYLPLDEDQQVIPYVQVVEGDGTIKEYTDITTPFDPAMITSDRLKKMDCISCHNRITHLILAPRDVVDQLMAKKEISTDIPAIHWKAIDVLSYDYGSVEEALDAIATLDGYYQTNYPDYYAANKDKISAAIDALQISYEQSVFPKQKATWTSHTDEIGHLRSPGCFRCHDGKHLDKDQQAIRLECNVCHSIPVVTDVSNLVTKIEVGRGPEPESHLNANWIGLHRDIFDSSCANCHSTDNPGGSSDTSFCSNSACHGTMWKYAGLDAPGLREILQAQLPPSPVPEPTPPPTGPLTYNDTIGPLLTQRCGTCHGTNAIKGLNLTTYAAAMAGGSDGAVIVPGDPAASKLISVQTAGSHPAQFTAEEMVLIQQWIEAGAPEK